MIATIAGILIVVGLAVAIALRPAHTAPPFKPDGEPPAPAPTPTIPETIRNADPRGAGAGHSTGRGRFESRDDAGRQVHDRQSLGPDRERQAELEVEQDQRALGASILFDVRSSPEDRTPASTPNVTIRAAPGVATSTGAAGGCGLGTNDPNGQSQKDAFLESEGASRTADTLAARVERPPSPYEVLAGTIVPAVLITAIRSDLPGPVIAQVRENVYDTVTGNVLLIPQGARLLARYDAMVVWGQDRVLVCWNRLLFPNGDSIDLECMPAADLQGQAGLADQVDEHWARLIAGAAVSSLLAATAQGAAGNTTGFSPSVPQLWANGGAQAVNQTGQQIVHRDLIVAPTIVVRPGFSVNVIVNRDMVLPPYGDSTEP